MAPGIPPSNSQSDSSSKSIQPPAVTLPKGGSIRGMGEKFAANPVTGTGSMSVPITTSPGRSGFGPQLSLSYDSGTGNTIFGFGWSLSNPSITRKTDKGLPSYNDDAESDVFILSGSEDLVPTNEIITNRTISAQTFKIKRYRPRIEGLFAQIERWTNTKDAGDVHWRSITRDNVLNIYGNTDRSRIADPMEKTRIFSWLISETRDDKGNGILYQYEKENAAGVDFTNACEANRGDANDLRRQAGRYVKRIFYGNRIPLLDNSTHNRPLLLNYIPIEQQIIDHKWMFEVVFDYGEHNINAPGPKDSANWNYRSDPFSSYRSGFEVRTTRLCSRVLMFHHFGDEPGVGNDCVVSSTDFIYSPDHNKIYSFLNAVQYTGYKRGSTGYDKRSKPPLEFIYSQPVIQQQVKDVDITSLENLPIGADGQTYQWTDLHGEGIPGLLTEQGRNWYYKRNISPILDGEVGLSPVELVAVKPNVGLNDGAQFMDLAGDGLPDLVVMGGHTPGFYEHDTEEGWESFRPYKYKLNRDPNDSNTRLVDLDGDQHADILITDDEGFVWHPSLGEDGFGPAMKVAKAVDEEKGPHLVFADGTQSIYLSDMSGDGLSDLVRIRNGEICYWPNLGFCHFGAKISMDNAPLFDTPDHFDQKRIRLADIDGSGTTDIIYLHADGVRVYFNEAGNSWGAEQKVDVSPGIDNMVSISTTDLLGNGTACLVWSSPLGADRLQIKYVSLMGDQKPHLLVRTINNMGVETVVHYASSVKFYLQDKYAGKPWITKLPFPVHVVERVETFDYVSRNIFVSRYAYHHGYFDGEEREFRGFAMVEQWDTEQLAALTASDALPEPTNISQESHVPPSYTKTWFHTGAYIDSDKISNFFGGELDDTILPSGLSLDEEREACRALKGSMLRQETYAIDGSPKQDLPYSVTEQNFTISCLQAIGGNRHGVFFTHPRESLGFHYERNLSDPRISHSMTLEVDPYGNVLRSLSIGYGRQPGISTLGFEDRKKQEQTLITYSENVFTDPTNQDDNWRPPLPVENKTYEVTGFSLTAVQKHFDFDLFADIDFKAINDLTEIPYEQQVNYSAREKRLIERTLTLYRSDDLTALLTTGQVMPMALPGESYKLSITATHAKKVYVDSGKMSQQELGPCDDRRCICSWSKRQ